jgi:hypothetical protein
VQEFLAKRRIFIRDTVELLCGQRYGAFEEVAILGGRDPGKGLQVNGLVKEHRERKMSAVAKTCVELFPKGTYSGLHLIQDPPQSLGQAGLG